MTTCVPSSRKASEWFLSAETAIIALEHRATGSRASKRTSGKRPVNDRAALLVTIAFSAMSVALIVLSLFEH
jgi:hypothetical protein